MIIGQMTSAPFLLLAGVVHPAYQTYKALDSGSTTESARWLQYWMIFVAFSQIEFLFDMIGAYVPLYFEAKLLFVLWLSTTRFQGATLLCEKYVKPFLKTHESKIDEQIAFVSARAANFKVETSAQRSTGSPPRPRRSRTPSPPLPSPPLPPSPPPLPPPSPPPPPPQRPTRSRPRSRRSPTKPTRRSMTPSTSPTNRKRSSEQRSAAVSSIRLEKEEEDHRRRSARRSHLPTTRAVTGAREQSEERAREPTAVSRLPYHHAVRARGGRNRRMLHRVL